LSRSWMGPTVIGPNIRYPTLVLHDSFRAGTALLRLPIWRMLSTSTHTTASGRDRTPAILRRRHAPDCSFCQILITRPPTNSILLWHTARRDEVLSLNRRMRCRTAPPPSRQQRPARYLTANRQARAVGDPVVSERQAATVQYGHNRDDCATTGSTARYARNRRSPDVKLPPWGPS